MIRHNWMRLTHLALATMLGTICIALPAQAQNRTPLGSLLQQDIAGGLFLNQSTNEEVILFTPRGSPVDFGIRYSDTTLRNDAHDYGTAASLTDFLDMDARLEKRFGELGMTMSGRLGAARDLQHRQENATTWSTGLDLNVERITLSGSVIEQQAPEADDVRGYEASVQYNTGPWGFSMSYTSGPSIENRADSSDPDDRLRQYRLALNYRIAEGIDVGAYGGYVSLQTNLDESDQSTPDDDVRGFVLGTGLRLEF